MSTVFFSDVNRFHIYEETQENSSYLHPVFKMCLVYRAVCRLSHTVYKVLKAEQGPSTTEVRG